MPGGCWLLLALALLALKKKRCVCVRMCVYEYIYIYTCICIYIFVCVSWHVIVNDGSYKLWIMMAVTASHIAQNQVEGHRHFEPTTRNPRGSKYPNIGVLGFKYRHCCFGTLCQHVWVLGPSLTAKSLIAEAIRHLLGGSSAPDPCRTRRQ